MPDIAISARGLSKSYVLGERSGGYRRLGDSAATLARRLVRRRGSAAEKDILWALRNVSLDIEQGEVVGIIGSNGAGKSTFLKILSRITEPTEGSAEIHGRVGSLLEVGTGFHPELTGGENVYLNGAILGMRRAEIKRRFDDIISFAELGRFVDTPVKRYSSGMYVRLAFAVAAHLEPEILLVDEVLAVGDAAFQKRCLGKMGEIARGGRTVLFVSHNLGAVSNLCTRAIHIAGGSVVADDDAATVVAGYIRSLSESADAGGGVVDLKEAKRGKGLQERQAQFNWVRTLNGDGSPVTDWLEGEPVLIEVGFELFRPFSTVQLGCSVSRLAPHVELFTVPSPEIGGVMEPGHYTARLALDPNPLREGTYSLGLKLFCDGTRHDTLPETALVSVARFVSPDDDPSYFAGWVAGTLRMPFSWSAPVRGSGDRPRPARV